MRSMERGAHPSNSPSQSPNKHEMPPRNPSHRQVLNPYNKHDKNSSHNGKRSQGSFDAALQLMQQSVTIETVPNGTKRNDENGESNLVSGNQDCNDSDAGDTMLQASSTHQPKENICGSTPLHTDNSNRSFFQDDGSKLHDKEPSHPQLSSASSDSKVIGMSSVQNLRQHDQQQQQQKNKQQQLQHQYQKPFQETQHHRQQQQHQLSHQQRNQERDQRLHQDQQRDTQHQETIDKNSLSPQHSGHAQHDQDSQQHQKPHQSSNEQQQSQQSKKRRSVPALIEEDASIAFSSCRPLASLDEFPALPTAGEQKSKPPKSKCRKYSSNNRNDANDRRHSVKFGQKRKSKSKSGKCQKNYSTRSGDRGVRDTGEDIDGNGHSYHNDHNGPLTTLEKSSPFVPAFQIDSVLQSYLPQLLHHNQFTIPPYRMGRRDLPPNQLEVILRRRAVRKKQKGVVATASEHSVAITATTIDKSAKFVPKQISEKKSSSLENGSAPTQIIHRPPSRESNPSFSSTRRTLFPTTQPGSHGQPQHNHPNQQAKVYDDDSTISSDTFASSWTPNQNLAEQSPSNATQATSTQKSAAQLATATSLTLMNLTSPIAATVTSEIKIPTFNQPSHEKAEEIVGDTSLGLKLIILQGKVVITHITPLDDGRASPAQLCGLLKPGDVIIGVDGRSMITPSNKPVNQEKLMHNLKPLSEPTDENGQFAREVRLRVALSGGENLRKEHSERERIREEERLRREKLGLDAMRGGSGGGDPASDIFSIASFMGVDQHSGMPLFGHSWDEHHRHGHGRIEEEKMENEETDEEAGEEFIKKAHLSPRSLPTHSTKNTISARIAHEVALDREYIRHCYSSEFFTLNKNYSLLLRPPSPPPTTPLTTSPNSLNDEMNQLTPFEATKQLFQRANQTIAHAKHLVSIVESQDRGKDNDFDSDEDPMEVASRVCGTASIKTGRTGASRRRWHRGDSTIGGGTTGGGTMYTVGTSYIGTIVGDVHSTAPSTFSSQNPLDDRSSGESGVEGVEGCDHRLLVELAANNDSWKRGVLKRLESYVEATEKEVRENREGKAGPSGAGSLAGLGRKSSGSNKDTDISTVLPGFDSLLFGGDVASMLATKKQSLALPPGEMTSMLFDLVEHLESNLPDQIFMKDDSSSSHFNQIINHQLNNATNNFSPEKITLSKPQVERKVDVNKATDFLVRALAIWLKSFRPLPWKQRRSLWPSHLINASNANFGDSSMVSSKMDDNMSLSVASMGGITTAPKSVEDKRNLREVIEDLELDQETRRETCTLVTFYFAHNFERQLIIVDSISCLPEAIEKEAESLIDSYGAYLDLYESLKVAGKLRSKILIDKLISVAKYDAYHKDAVKALQKAQVLLFYEPPMLSALLSLLPSISENLSCNDDDFISLLVSAYPDLQPWYVREVSQTEEISNFYFKYLSALMHSEDGNDAAKRDEVLVKEWCLMLSSPEDIGPKNEKTQMFFHIASPNDYSSQSYHRDLPLLMGVSMKMSQFGLALDLANEIISDRIVNKDSQGLEPILRNLHTISDVAIKGNNGELNAPLLSRIILFYNVLSPFMNNNGYEFSVTNELSKLLEQCTILNQQQGPYASVRNISACLSVISENAPPCESLRVFSGWGFATIDSPSLVTAMHTCLIRGARDGVRKELSGSLLRIRRAREEGKRPMVEHEGVDWKSSTPEELEDEADVEGSIWSSVMDGSLVISK